MHFLNVIALLVAQTDKSQRKQVFQFWQKVGLPMGKDMIVSAVGRLLRRRGSAASVGGIVGLLASASAVFFIHSPVYGTHFWLVTLPAMIIGMAAFDSGMALRDTLFRLRTDSPRLARATAVSLSYYISPWRLRTAPLLLVLAALLNGASLVLGSTGDR